MRYEFLWWPYNLSSLFIFFICLIIIIGSIIDQYINYRDIYAWLITICIIGIIIDQLIIAPIFRVKIDNY